MAEKVRVGMRGQVVIPKRLRKKLNIEHGVILEIEEVEGGLLLKPINPIMEMRGLGRGVFGDPVRYQRNLRREWEAEPLEDRA
jgi:AbrB family looped-hinge helix DNA binding protein